MLDTLLHMIAEGGVRSQAELANKLGIGRELLEQMLEELQRMGYLAPVAGTRAGECPECPLLNICTAGSSPRVYALTEKGARLAGL